MTRHQELLQESLVAIGLSLIFIKDEKILEICNNAINEITKELENYYSIKN